MVNEKLKGLFLQEWYALVGRSVSKSIFISRPDFYGEDTAEDRAVD